GFVLTNWGTGQEGFEFGTTGDGGDNDGVLRGAAFLEGEEFAERLLAAAADGVAAALDFFEDLVVEDVDGAEGMVAIGGVQTVIADLHDFVLDAVVAGAKPDAAHHV